MWIWYVSRSNGGSLDAIAARAKLSNINTVFVKSSDGGNAWTQFSPALVAGLHASGLRVCAWQFIYGTVPVAEANAGAAAVAKGADCLLIDAEGSYEGKYASADTYMRTLRTAVGASYPIGLAGFPYVDYHPGFPYSVFLAPGGAQFNLPQMYWKAIGTSVDNVFAHTYPYNRVYHRPILPLGQTYLSPKKKSVLRFRRIAMTLGAPGVSWWSWQETTRREWKWLRKTVTPAAAPPITYPSLHVGSKGDLVVWAQELLAGAGLDSPVGGVYGTRTSSNVATFQQSRGLPPTGVLDASTWPALLQVTPTYVSWGAAAHASLGAHGSEPASASLPARRNEIPPGKHR